MLRRMPRFFGKLFRGSSLVALPRRCFAESLPNATKDLIKSLEGEIEHEKDQGAGAGEETLSFLNNSGWNCKASLNTTKIELTKSLGSVKLTIQFDARADEGALDGENSEKNEERDDGTEGVDFILFVDNGKAHQLILECMSSNTQIEISSISVLENAAAEEIKKDKSALFTKNHYAGPNFETLDENLQEAIVSYTNTLGLNDELGSFIENKAFEHENELYQNWLKDFKNILN